MLSMNTAELQKLLDEIQAAIEAAPSPWWPVKDPSLGLGLAWCTNTQGWALVVLTWNAQLMDGTQPADGTAAKGSTIVRLTPELAQLALRKARGA